MNVLSASFLRRSLAAFSVAFSVAAVAGPPADISKVDRNMEIKSVSARNAVWYDPAKPPIRIGGLNWFPANGKYRRLPESTKLPSAVDNLAFCTTGVTAAYLA